MKNFKINLILFFLMCLTCTGYAQTAQREPGDMKIMQTNSNNPITMGSRFLSRDGDIQGNVADEHKTHLASDITGGEIASSEISPGFRSRNKLSSIPDLQPKGENNRNANPGEISISNDPQKAIPADFISKRTKTL